MSEGRRGIGVMTMNRTKRNLLLDGILMVMFMVCELTGLMLHGSSDDGMMGLHTITGMLLLIMTFGHVLIHRRMIGHSIARAAEGKGA